MEHNTIECKEGELWIIQKYEREDIDKYLRGHRDAMSKAFFVKSKAEVEKKCFFRQHCVIATPTTAKSIIHVLNDDEKAKDKFIADVNENSSACDQLAVKFDAAKDSIVVRWFNYKKSTTPTSNINTLYAALTQYYQLQNQPNKFVEVGVEEHGFKVVDKRKLSESSKKTNSNPRPTKIQKKDDDKDIASATKSPTQLILKTINRNHNNNNASTPIYSSPTSVASIASQSDNEILLLLANPTKILYFNTITYNMNNNRNGLVHIVNNIFQHYRFDQDPGIDINKANNFVVEIQSKYNPGIPFHNTAHAASVVLNLHYLFECVPGLFSNLEKVTAFLCAAGIDVGHDGFNNAFHQAMKSGRYQQYRESTQEKHHWQIINDTLCQENSNWKCDLKFYADTLYINDIIRQIIIETDHPLYHDKHQKYLENNYNKLILDQTDKNKVLSAFLHGADIMASCKDYKIAIIWGIQRSEEFQKQGDVEVMSTCFGKIVSTPRDLFSRESNFFENQKEWINSVVLPYFSELKKWCRNHDLTDKLLENARQNV